MNKWYSLFLLLFLSWLIVISGSIYASVKRIDGPVYPIRYSFSDIRMDMSSERAAQLAQKTQDLQPRRLSFWPFRTGLAHCSRLNTKGVDFTRGSRSVFIIGDDSASLHWLKQYRQRLKKIGAIGLVIQAQNLSSLQHVQKVAGNLSLYLVSSDGFKKKWDVHCYPAFISLNQQPKH